VIREWGTKDYAFGQLAARNLSFAESNKEIFNADSYEYLENSPSQRKPEL